mgnify:FL=1
MKSHIYIFIICIVVNTQLVAQIVSDLAGSGTFGSIDANDSLASFASPTGVCADVSGNIYVVETSTIRKITPLGVVTTIAGSAFDTGSADGTGSSARFYNPFGICIDPSGNIFVADTYNHKIRKITAGGVVTTLAGDGTLGSLDGTGTSARFNAPVGICSDPGGNLYVADCYNHKIRKITPAGVVTTIAGSGAIGSADGFGLSASFNYPYGICTDPAGGLYVTEIVGNKVRQIYGTAVITFAGSGTAGSTNATGTLASFDHPTGICSDASYNLYVTDQYNHKIRKMTSSAVVTTFAGTGVSGSLNGPVTVASFNYPHGICFDGSGNLFISDQVNNKIRKITTSVTTNVLDNATTNAFKVYPNPSTGELFFESNELMNDCTIKIIDASGRIIFTQYINSNKELLNLKKLDKGFYFLWINVKNNTVIKKICIE